MDLSTLSVDDLRKLRDQISAEIKNRETQSVLKARTEILEIANRVGIPLNELLGKKPKATGGGSSPIKFRHPQDAEKQWSGRGRIPKWVKEWQSEGKSLDALRVG